METITKVLNTDTDYTLVLSHKVAQVVGKKREHLNLIESHFNVKIFTVVTDKEKLKFLKEEFPDKKDDSKEIDELNKTWSVIKVIGEKQFIPPAIITPKLP